MVIEKFVGTGLIFKISKLNFLLIQKVLKKTNYNLFLSPTNKMKDYKLK